jgi:hypothetical protein
MELQNWPFTDTCDICGEKWTEADKEYIYHNVTRDFVGTVNREDEPVNWDHNNILVNRHTDTIRCLVNISKKLGIFQGEKPS